MVDTVYFTKSCCWLMKESWILFIIHSIYVVFLVIEGYGCRSTIHEIELLFINDEFKRNPYNLF